MPCWRLWRQFDVILKSFVWRVDVNLMSNFSSIFTSIFTSNVYAKIDVTSIIWPKFDLKLTSIWCDIDVISTSFRRHQWRHLDIKTLTSFWWWNLWSILTSILTSNVYAKIDVTSIIWPKFDLRFTSIWRNIDVILTSFRCHQWCYRWRHLDIKTLTSFWWWNLWSILTSILTSNVDANIDVTSIIWPEFDLILTSEVWLL